MNKCTLTTTDCTWKITAVETTHVYQLFRMLFYRVFVLLLSANFYQQYEQIRNPNLFIVSTHNYSRDFTLNKLSVSAYEVTFANDLYIDIFTTLFYHLKHNRIVPLSIPVEYKQRHQRRIQRGRAGVRGVRPPS